MARPIDGIVNPQKLSIRQGYVFWYRQSRRYPHANVTANSHASHPPGFDRARQAFLNRSAVADRRDRLLILIQTAKLRWYLDPDRFRAWIEAQVEIVGTANSMCACPLARYLSESLGVAVGASDYRIEILDEFDGAIVMLATPSWAARFIREIDAWRGDVLKEAAIAALDKALEQTQWRKCNEQQRHDRTKTECNNFQGYQGE